MTWFRRRPHTNTPIPKIPHRGFGPSNDEIMIEINKEFRRQQGKEVKENEPAPTVRDSDK